MKTRILSLLPLLVFGLVVPVWTQHFTVTIPEGFEEPGKLFVVKHTGDTTDANPGDGACADTNGHCTLRAAVDETNANNAPADVIIFELSYPAVIELAEGTLNISETATSIIGPGARRLTIKRSASTATPFRIFNLTNADARGRTVIRGLRLEGGSVGNSMAGGAVRVGPGATADLTEMWFAGNTAGNGGAVSNEGMLTITRSLLTANAATAEGGGLHLAPGSFTRVTNSTITLNTASNGGAIYAAGSLISANNTITQNAATAAASSIASATGSTIDVLNTIIGSDTSLPVTTITGTFSSRGNNIVTDARGATGFSNSTNEDQVSDNNAIDPLLGALADNGGQTDTRAPLPNSRAIDRGNSCVYDAVCSWSPLPTLRLRWDQRTGYARRSPLLNGVVDVGSVESGNATWSTSLGIGTFSPSIAPRRIGFVFAINVVTGQRRTAILRTSGAFRFSNLESGVVYVLDHHIKKGRVTPFVFAPEF